MKTASSRQSLDGLTFVEVLVILSVLFVLAVLLLPWSPPSRAKPQRIACVNNLKQIGLALRMWSNDQAEKFPWSVSVTNESPGTMEFTQLGQAWRHFQAISNELSSPKVLRCPSDTTRPRATNWDEFTGNEGLSYFAGLDAHETRPQSILSGDRNLAVNGKPASGLLRLTVATRVEWTKELHNGQGNIGLEDGSVQQFTTSGLCKQIEVALSTDTNRPVIRLALPE
jgi:hypothetical protein